MELAGHALYRQARIGQVGVNVALDGQEQGTSLGHCGCLLCIGRRAETAGDQAGSCLGDGRAILRAQRAGRLMDRLHVGGQHMAEPGLARQHNPVQPIGMLEKRLEYGPRHDEVQITEVLGLRLQCLGEIEDTDIAWPDPDGPAFNLSGITAPGVELDEVVINAAASDGKRRAAKLLTACRHTPKHDWPEMVAIDCDLEGIDRSWIGDRYIEQGRGDAAPCPECLLRK